MTSTEQRAKLEQVAKELARQCVITMLGTDDYESESSMKPLAELLAAALAACAREVRLDEAVDWRDAAVSLTRSAHEKWMESRLAELRGNSRA